MASAGMQLDTVRSTPESPKFRQKECARFQPSSRNMAIGVQITAEEMICCCGRKIGEHKGANHGGFTASEMTDKRIKTLEKHKLETSSGFHKGYSGTIKFQRSSLTTKKVSDVSKFQRLADDNTLEDVVNKLLLKKWRLNMDSVVAISVCGNTVETKDIDCLHEIADGIVEAAKSTNGMIVTSGMDSSISGKIGECLERKQTWKEMCDKEVVPCTFCVGVANWAAVNNNQILSGQKPGNRGMCYYPKSGIDGRATSLNPGHTHFILFDDGKIDRMKETDMMKLTAGLLENLKRGYSILPVQLFIGGFDERILHLFDECLFHKVPVVLLTGAGGVTDLIARYYMCRNSGREVSKESLQADLREVLYNAGDGHLKKLVEDIERRYKNDRQKQSVVKICELGNICDGKIADLDTSILVASLRGSHQHQEQENYDQQLKIAIKWKKFEVADQLIFSRDWSQSNSQLDLKENVEECFNTDQPDFVSALLSINEDRGGLTEDILTGDLLVRLYGAKKLTKDPLKDIFDRTKIKEVEDIAKMISKLSLPVAEFSPNAGVVKYKDFLIWSVLSKKWRMVDFLLKMLCIEDHDILTSHLAVSFLCKHIYLKQPNEHITEEYRTIGYQYQERAVAVLDYMQQRFSDKPDDGWQTVAEMLDKPSKVWSDYSPITLASEGNFKIFIASDPVNRLLREKWSDRREDWYNLVPPRIKFYTHMVCHVALVLALTGFIYFGYRPDRVTPFEYFLVIWTYCFIAGRCFQLYYRCKETRLEKRPFLRYRFNYVWDAGAAALMFSLLTAGFVCHVAFSRYTEQVKTLYSFCGCCLSLQLVHYLRKHRIFASQIVIMFRVVFPVLIFLFFIVILLWSALLLISSGMCLQFDLLDDTALFDVAFKLYLFVFGEYAFNFPEEMKCETLPGGSLLLVYAVLGIYIFLGNLLLLSLVGSVVGAASDAAKGKTDMIWKTSWFKLLWIYKRESILPPPLNLLEYFVWLVCGTCKVCKQCKFGPHVGYDQTDTRNNDDNSGAKLSDKLHIELANTCIPSD